MKKYIIFGLTLLMAFPLCVVAQDEDTDQEEHTWDVLEPVEVESRYFLPTRREDSLDSETFIFD